MSAPQAQRLVDRTTELNELQSLLDHSEDSMVLVTGRRRVGKTFLLSNTWPDDQTFYFVATEGTSRVNRLELIRAASQRFGIELDPADYPNWRTVFQMLLDLNRPHPLVVILDEFQYMMGKREAAPSHLAAVWDSLKRERRLVLVLCGSAVRTMEGLQASDAALHGRITRTIKLTPFDYLDAAAMLPFASTRDCAIAYGLVGGTPRYLKSLAGRGSLVDGIASEVLAPGGPVRMQVETLMDQEQGLRSRQSYKALLSAIGAGKTIVNEIAQYAGTPQGAATKLMLSLLDALGYVTAERNFDAKSNEPFRYRLADPALRFQYEIVSQFRSELVHNTPSEVWQSHIAARIDTFMGHTFERIAEQAYHRHRARLALPMVDIWGRWEGSVRDRGGDAETAKSIEVDIVTRLTDGRMMTGAVKWGDLGLGVHNKHLRELAILANNGHSWARKSLLPGSPLIYVAGGNMPSDFKERAEQDGHPVFVFTLDEIFHDRLTYDAESGQ